MDFGQLLLMPSLGSTFEGIDLADADRLRVSDHVSIRVCASADIAHTLIVLVAAVTGTVKQATNQTSLHVFILVTCTL